uniref:Uncharacterized protein n=1 Tax=Ixodes ricinus TaxID=34613 RepID=A0A6B0UUA9_IXORI
MMTSGKPLLRVMTALLRSTGFSCCSCESSPCSEHRVTTRPRLGCPGSMLYLWLIFLMISSCSWWKSDSLHTKSLMVCSISLLSPLPFSLRRLVTSSTPQARGLRYPWPAPFLESLCKRPVLRTCTTRYTCLSTSGLPTSVNTVK